MFRLSRSSFGGLGTFAGHVHLSIKGRRTSEGKFDWKEATVDAGVISGITLFTGLGTLAASGVINPAGVCVLFSAVGVEFLSVIAAKRGLTPAAKKSP